MTRKCSINPLPAMRDWYERNVAQPARDRSEAMKVLMLANKPIAKIFTPISEIEMQAIRALKDVTFPPATGAKRFARDTQYATQMTELQRKALWSIVYRFRRQITDQSLVAHAAQIGGKWSRPAAYRSKRVEVLPLFEEVSA